jgi:PAS domain-containing protein
MSQSLSPTPDPAPKGNLSWLPTREDMSLIFESSGEAMFVTDRDGRILSLNPVARRFVGRHHDVIGTMFHNLVGCLFSREGDDRGCPLAHTVRTGEVTMGRPISGSEPMGRRLRLLRRSGPGVEAWSVSVPWLSVAT